MEILKEKIKQKALNIGFDVVGFTEPKIDQDTKKELEVFLQKKFHGEMSWLEKHFEKKIDPKMVWNEVQTVVVLGLNYGPTQNPIFKNNYKDFANASVYANNKDYHQVIKKKLNILNQWIKKELRIESKVFVDTSPLLEKYFAKKTNVGWQGKHTNLVSKKFGSWLFLAEIFLPIKLNEDNVSLNNCGHCKKCLDICPTGALIDEYKIDARKCISYLTIEYKGPFPQSIRKKIGNKIYGCDDCLAVCPWNKFSKPTNNSDFLSSRNEKELIFFLNFDERKFKKYFRNSPIKRIGWVSFMRNIIIASGNSEKKKLIRYLKELSKNKNPIIRGACIWSLYQLTRKKEKKFFKDIRKNERNSYVLYELDMIDKFF